MDDADASKKREYNRHRSKFNWPDQLHAKFINSIFDIGLTVVNAYAMEETVSAISDNPDYTCESESVARYLTEMNEHRQLARYGT
jgi:hypothetical protein